MKYLVLMPFLFFYYSCCVAQSTLSQQSEPERLDSLFTVAQSVFHLPGFSIGVIKDGKRIFAKGYGKKELGKQAEVITSSVFHMASLSKPFVALAILQLSEAGKLKLDEHLTTYIPYFRMADDRYKQVTIRQMLSHISGFPDVADYGWKNPKYDLKARERYIKDSISHEMLLSTPGQDFSYSNMAYDVLAEVISIVSGVVFEDYMQIHIFKPCGMTHTTFLGPETNSSLQTSPHYLGDKGRIVPSPVYPYNRVHAGSSTLHSNVEDMLLWLGMLMNGGKLNGHQVISKENLQLMLSTQHKFDTQSGMGLGWFIEMREGKTFISHGGSDVGYSTYMAIIPQEKTAIILMSNFYRFVPVDELAALAMNILHHQPLRRLKTPIALAIAPVINDEGIIKARQLYTKLKKDHQETYNFDESSLITLGYSYYYLGDLQKAIDVLCLNAEIYPKSVWNLQTLGEVYSLAGAKKKAAATFQKALELDPECAPCKLGLKNTAKD
ncbi:beta-lactamase family protein [Pedobacter panaciterrae]|uniref:serine hydrolase domain-containing protein n=1 Tax=Pedobacter panaciterrae TaxID=363849 RepID=UPI00155DB44B|nr:serine hydrolase domain-containing protein [Pedobacter panaciterrae]NQX54453.1 beta-lactamase family protein [Pedobacter panaciterrae]